MDKLIKFRGPDKKKFTDREHSDDFLKAERFKKVYLGRLALYYKDFFTICCLPYDYIERAYKGVNIVTPDDSPPIEYFRLILLHDGQECANIIFGERDSELVDRLVLRINEIHPETQIGYVEPEKKPEQKRSLKSFFFN